MKVLDRINLVIFSIIILALSLVTCVIIAGLLDVEIVFDLVKNTLSTTAGRGVTLGIAVLLALMATKSIFLNSYTKEKSKEGILLENENGKLLVSKDTVENLASVVIKNYASIENSTTKVEVDSENKINLFITLEVYQEAIIKDLAAKIQTDIKEAVKNSLDLEIKEVNIRVKDIKQKKEPVVKE